MIDVKTAKKKLSKWAKGPLHPQWLHRPNAESYKHLLGKNEHGSTVLDIGCYSMWARKFIPPSCNYIGLDYYETAKNWYGSEPHVFADALSLPIAPASMDSVILIDVLEHISNPWRLLEQIHDALKPDGTAIIALPFLYPVHDAPKDFFRLTKHGVEQLAQDTGFSVEYINHLGSPIITSAFLMNVGLSKTALNWIRQRSLWSLLVPFLVMAIPLVNIAAWLLSKVEASDDFMANSYEMILKKPNIPLAKSSKETKP